MKIALTILLDGPGSHCFHWKDIRIVLASRTHQTLQQSNFDIANGLHQVSWSS